MWDTSNTFPEFENETIDTAVLPVGAIEQHGRHLPISVDWELADALGRGVAKRLDAFLVPGLPFGNSEAHTGFQGVVSIRPETLKALVTDIVHSLFDQGFRRIVVLNTHGGNLVLKLAVRALNMSGAPGRVLLVFPPQLASRRLAEIVEGFDDELHAGDLETSLMLHLSPEKVRADRIDHVPDVSPEYFDYAPMKAYCPDGIWGRPSRATAEKGRRLFDIMVEETVNHMEATFLRLEQL